MPIVPFDTDDWCYMGYYRLPIPIWGDWNPSRVLPEVMMPYVSIFAARVIYPLTGDYIGSITWMYAFVVTAFISAGGARPREDDEDFICSDSCFTASMHVLLCKCEAGIFCR